MTEEDHKNYPARQNCGGCLRNAGQRTQKYDVCCWGDGSCWGVWLRGLESERVFVSVSVAVVFISALNSENLLHAFGAHTSFMFTNPKPFFMDGTFMLEPFNFLMRGVQG